MKIATAPRPYICSIVALVLALSGTAGIVHADNAVKKAESQLADLRFEEASETAVSALKKGSRGPSEVVALYMLLGQISASMSKDKDAVSYFHNALSISSDAALPAGASPKLSEPFDKAKARIEGTTPIALEYEVEEDGRVIVTISSDPANLVGGAALIYKEAGKEQIKKGRGRDTVKMKVPEGATDLQIVAVDLYGNQINTATALDLESDGEETVVQDKATERRGRPLFSRWQLYAGLTVGAAIGGGYFAFKTKSLVDDAEALEDGSEFTQAKKLEDRAKTKALYANIGFVAAALLAGTTYWVYTTKSGDSEKAPTTTSITPYLSPTEVGVAAALHF